MTAKCTASKRTASLLHPGALLAAIACAMLLVASTPTLAQTITKPSKPVTAKSGKATAAKPTSGNAGSGDYWSANTDLGKYSGGDPNEDRRPNPTRNVGRVPLQTGPGSVGFDSKPSNIGKFGDGRAMPGHEAYTQNPSSYVGLSLSVPSDSKSFPLLVPGGSNGW